MIEKWARSFVFAIILHGVIGLLLISTIDSRPTPVLKQPVVDEIIQASFLDDKKIAQEAQKLLQQTRQKRQQEEAKIKALANQRKKREQAEKQALEQIKQARQQAISDLAKIKARQIAEEKKAKALQIARQKQQKLEQQRREQAARQEKQRQQRLRQAAKERERQALLAKQQALLKQQQANAVKQKQQILRITQAIQQQVNQQWIKPALSSQGLSCTIKVKLLPSGDVMDVIVVRSSGQPLFDRSAENAVRKASPLPVPKDRTLFNAYFRQFSFEFNPN